MYTIKENKCFEFVIKNSKFITFLIKVRTLEEVNLQLDAIKDKYNDATHHCYGYIIDGKVKSSDDNEPGGTAGMPILNVLEKNQLNYILCVVVRYFGGIKLGAGGLVRAYSKSVVECLKQVDLIELIYGKKIEFSLSYSKHKSLEGLLNQVDILSQSFLDEVKIVANVENDILETLGQYSINYNVIEDILVEKKFH